MCVEIPEVRIGEPQVCGGVTVFPLFAGQPRPWTTLLSDEAMAAGTLAVSEVSETGEVAVPAGRQRRRPARPVRRGRGGPRRQAGPGPVQFGPGGGHEPDSHSRRLRRTGAMGHSSRQFASRLVLPAVAAARPEGRRDGRQARVWATIHRTALRLGDPFADGEHVRRVRTLAERRRRGCGAGCPMSRARWGSPSRWAGRSSASTSSTSRRPARRSGAGSPEGLAPGRGGDAGHAVPGERIGRGGQAV